MTTNSHHDRHAQRARELMLGADETRRFIQLATFGTCPDCAFDSPFRYESTLVHHARLCKGVAPVDHTAAAALQQAKPEPFADLHSTSTHFVDAHGRTTREQPETRRAYDAAQTEKCERVAKGRARLAALVADAQTLDPSEDKPADVLDTIDVDLRIVRKHHAALNRDDVHAVVDDSDEPSGYKPEAAALYDGTPGSASLSRASLPAIVEQHNGARLVVKLGSRTFSVRRNQWDNWHGYIGGKRVESFMNTGEGAQEMHARAWLDEQRSRYAPEQPQGQARRAARVTFRTERYEAAHGRKPRGEGEWAFGRSGWQQSGDASDVIWAHGAYVAAKKEAARVARERGITELWVLS